MELSAMSGNSRECGPDAAGQLNSMLGSFEKG